MIHSMLSFFCISVGISILPEILRKAEVGVWKINANKCKITPFIRLQAVWNECSKQAATKFTNQLRGERLQLSDSSSKE